MPEAPVSQHARAMADDEGGMPEQQQTPPGLTAAMDPVPDHGEASWEGRGRLEGLKALITGGDSGIGRAVAIAFAREGADVAINYLPEEQEDAQDVVGWIEKAGRTAVLVPGDVREEQSCRDIVDRAVEGLGGLNVVVNNAGFHWARGEAGLKGLATEDLERAVRTNLYGTLWISRAALPHLGRGDSIINTTSVQAYDPSVSMIDYAATKAALNNVTANLAAELGPEGIRVNAVAPGPVWTPLGPATKEPGAVANMGKETPLGRIGQPAELAGAYVFLASPAEASYVSGTVLGVTGGMPVF
ncbi:KR domain-containing protein [Kocuria rosea]|jgi:NAD(P)-dependent dehydrogenase (short-subunit alcohol dehydrogenase family)|uniref:SDR family oxidoreductase n=1 Tax=Kocuria TaxID=57493 RepID=UPI00037C2BDA|nr:MULTISPECIES: SDR family oxidoreductase [Kocuria]MCC5782747.1 NAD(P)-dependent dehydrogenase [Kocuria sp. CCUG 69068]EYT54504.1 oxidoreductase [Kocuria sp. UCD-OTCP]MCM3486195.1 SDR family oxidoreductase [Kocuria rosea]MEB2526625.1 SDR family oxidoreductase [Kocuria rosea]MEB2619294.1 SDR family oxidoreductase [Kocuria rosea]